MDEPHPGSCADLLKFELRIAGNLTRPRGWRKS
jgi:hypothetical protein